MGWARVLAAASVSSSTSTPRKAFSGFSLTFPVSGGIHGVQACKSVKSSIAEILRSWHSHASSFSSSSNLFKCFSYIFFSAKIVSSIVCLKSVNTWPCFSLKTLFLPRLQFLLVSPSFPASRQTGVGNPHHLWLQIPELFPHHGSPSLARKRATVLTTLHCFQARPSLEWHPAV